MKRILITGAGSGLGKGTALGLAKNGHHVIAAVHLWEQKTALLEEIEALGLQNIEVTKIDILDQIDRRKAWQYDIDILVNNAGIGETGPIAEIPVDLLRKVMETNVFGTLEFTQGFVKKMVERRAGKIFFVSSMAGVSTYPFLAPYNASKHALEAVAQCMRDELKPFDITVATINPAAFRTGFNDRMYDSVDQWYDENKNFTEAKAIRDIQESVASPDGQYDPEMMIKGMIDVIPKDKHKFRTMIPKEVEDWCKNYQVNQWTLEVEVKNSDENNSNIRAAS
ncbi:SDR family oxidoreductase [Sediminitomix flava]|uniref:Short-subunit dehydrogenase n=1 Tax=Sediminitomix flava TaxID=379075 RepID=A0A315ZI30_SEDFL|nr:SDR family oxidoreductase [Sediminitomix flava]PWJ44374.1 short-subunit dehydrogenase [Sediminitomix flava]